MRQSIEDGVTLEIIYEGRTHNAEVPDQGSMDAAFEDVFSDYNLQQRLDILGYGSRDAYLEAEPTIEAKAQDMVEHYLAHVFPNGYKAQVVATSREAAVRYKKHLDTTLAAAVAKLEPANTCKLDLDRLKAMKTDVVISGRYTTTCPTSKSIPTRHGTRRASRASSCRSAVKKTVSTATWASSLSTTCCLPASMRRWSR